MTTSTTSTVTRRGFLAGATATIGHLLAPKPPKPVAKQLQDRGRATDTLHRPPAPAAGYGAAYTMGY